MLVLDASAAVDLLLGDELGRRVGVVLATDDVVAPELLDVEVLSALARHVRAGELQPDQADSRVRTLQQLPARRIAHQPLLTRAWELRPRVRVADAFYVACAELLGATLVTTDGRLSRAVPSGVTVTFLS